MKIAHLLFALALISLMGCLTKESRESDQVITEYRIPLSNLDAGADAVFDSIHVFIKFDGDAQPTHRVANVAASSGACTLDINTRKAQDIQVVVEIWDEGRRLVLFSDDFGSGQGNTQVGQQDLGGGSEGTGPIWGGLSSVGPEESSSSVAMSASSSAVVPPSSSSAVTPSSSSVVVSSSSSAVAPSSSSEVTVSVGSIWDRAQNENGERAYVVVNGDPGGNWRTDSDNGALAAMQLTDNEGALAFKAVVPGWYAGAWAMLGFDLSEVEETVHFAQPSSICVVYQSNQTLMVQLAPASLQVGGNAPNATALDAASNPTLAQFVIPSGYFSRMEFLYLPNIELEETASLELLIHSVGFGDECNGTYVPISSPVFPEVGDVGEPDPLPCEIQIATEINGFDYYKPGVDLQFHANPVDWVPYGFEWWIGKTGDTQPASREGSIANYASVDTGDYTVRLRVDSAGRSPNFCETTFRVHNAVPTVTCPAIAELLDLGAAVTSYMTPEDDDDSNLLYRSEFFLNNTLLESGDELSSLSGVQIAVTLPTAEEGDYTWILHVRDSTGAAEPCTTYYTVEEPSHLLFSQASDSARIYLPDNQVSRPHVVYQTPAADVFFFSALDSIRDLPNNKKALVVRTEKYGMDAGWGSLTYQWDSYVDVRAYSSICMVYQAIDTVEVGLGHGSNIITTTLSPVLEPRLVNINFDNFEQGGAFNPANWNYVQFFFHRKQSGARGTAANTFILYQMGLGDACGSASEVVRVENVSFPKRSEVVGGYSFPTVVIGHRTWMAENLNVGVITNSDSSPQSDNSITERYCYGLDDELCDRYGGLYTWREALDLPDSCITTACVLDLGPVTQGICPAGWAIPSDTDWDDMMMLTLWGDWLAQSGATWLKGYDAEDEAWNANGVVDIFGFSAKPGGGFAIGLVNGYDGLGTKAAFWSAGAGMFSMESGATGFSRSPVSNLGNRALSVRCIKD